MQEVQAEDDEQVEHGEMQLEQVLEERSAKVVLEEQEETQVLPSSRGEELLERQLVQVVEEYWQVRQLE